jgi:hypothetical protein|tara:strand:+ start:6325 stop:6660 length:336 start_codon:yes stop_codon:yes gene_type:complete
MDSITILFSQALNVSLQVGDIAYYTDDANGVAIQKIGAVTSIDYSLNSITCSIEPSQPRPTLGVSFILFSKDNSTNINALTGYYAIAQYKNNNTKRAELYTVASEIFISSK